MRELTKKWLSQLIFHKLLDSEELFVVIQLEAEKLGYQLKAEQRGIAGTYLHFVKD